MLIAGPGVYHIYILSISLSMAKKDCSIYSMKALGPNQAYMLLKLRNNYYIGLIFAFGSITGNILQL